MSIRIIGWFTAPFAPNKPSWPIAAAILLAVDAEWIAGLSENVAENASLGLTLVWKLGLLVALSGLAFFLGWKFYKSYIQHHRLLNQKLDVVPDTSVLVLPVSKPNRCESSKYSDSAQLKKAVAFAKHDRGSIHAWIGNQEFDVEPTLETFCEPDLCVGTLSKDYSFRTNFSWQTGFIVTRAILAKEKNTESLRAIHLVPSTETSELTTCYAEMLAALAERYLKGKRVKAECKIVAQSDYRDPTDSTLYVVCHNGVDYSNFEKVQKNILDIVRYETELRRRAKIVVDVTGGTAAFTAAAAIASTRPDICYSHVPQEMHKTPAPFFYDVITEKTEVRGGG